MQVKQIYTYPVGDFLSGFPDDKCYFRNQDIISFDPNVCNISEQKKSSLKVSICDPNLKKTNDYLIIGCFVLGSLAFILMIMLLISKSNRYDY